VAAAKKSALESLGVLVGETWRQLRERLKDAEALEEEIWRRRYEDSLARALKTIDLEAEPKACAAEAEESLSAREIGKEKLRALEGEIARLGSEGVPAADIQRLFLEPTPAGAAEPPAAGAALASFTVPALSPPVPPEGAVAPSPPGENEEASPKGRPGAPASAGNG